MIVDTIVTKGVIRVSFSTLICLCSAFFNNCFFLFQVSDFHNADDQTVSTDNNLNQFVANTQNSAFPIPIIVGICNLLPFFGLNLVTFTDFSVQFG